MTLPKGVMTSSFYIIQCIRPAYTDFLAHCNVVCTRLENGKIVLAIMISDTAQFNGQFCKIRQIDLVIHLGGY